MKITHDASEARTRSDNPPRIVPASSLLVLTTVLAGGVAAQFLIGAHESEAATASARPDTNFAAVPAGVYVLDSRNADLVFQLAHYGGMSRPLLRFRIMAAEYQWDPAKPDATKVRARIEQNSFDSGYQDFDIRMNAPDVLGGYDVPSSGPYAPPYLFESTSVKFNGQKDKNGGLLGTMTGNFRMNGEEKPVTIEFTYNGTARDSSGQQRTGFSARGKLKRSDFGQTSVPTAGDEVEFQMELEFAAKGSSRYLRGTTIG